MNRMQAEAMGRALGYILVGVLTKWLHVGDETTTMVVGIAGEVTVMGLALYQTRKKAVANALLDMETSKNDDDGVLISPNGGKDAHVITVPKARHLARNVEHTKTLLDDLTKKGYKNLPEYNKHSYGDGGDSGE